MACNRANVPGYLHWDEQTKYTDADFFEEHNLYRLYFNGKNPLEFPAGIVTALSCKWSAKIEVGDITIIDDPLLGDTYCTASIGQLRTYSRKDEKINGNYIGWHKITCVFNHDPKVCDNSHSEVLIMHKVFNDPLIENDETIIFKKIYTHPIWVSGDAELNKDGKFYKTLRKDYRTDMLRYFLTN
jgi:hypothetical protein